MLRYFNYIYHKHSIHSNSGENVLYILFRASWMVAFFAWSFLMV